MPDSAEERFIDAVRAFQQAEEAARANAANTPPAAFQRVIIDLDAALPGLDGLSKGRALVLKAQALWWQYFVRLSQNAPKLYDPSAPADPLLAESHLVAVEGRKLLQRLKAPQSDLAWADDLVKKTTT
jgi:hypothetical protein